MARPLAAIEQHLCGRPASVSYFAPVNHHTASRLVNEPSLSEQSMDTSVVHDIGASRNQPLLDPVMVMPSAVNESRTTLVQGSLSLAPPANQPTAMNNAAKPIVSHPVGDDINLGDHSGFTTVVNNRHANRAYNEVAAQPLSTQTKPPTRALSNSVSGGGRANSVSGGGRVNNVTGGAQNVASDRYGQCGQYGC